MLLRNKKKEDINEGKWIGIGGKVQPGELPYDACLREFKEETNLTLIHPVLKGYILFPGLHNGEDEAMFLYRCDDYDGQLTTTCEEGTLSWIDNDQLDTLPVWEGDRYFPAWLNQEGIVQASLTYDGDTLVDVKII